MTVRIAQEAGSTISAKGLIIIAFIGILAYILLAEGKGESGSGSEGAGKRKIESVEPTESENRSSRHNSAGNTPVGSARTVSNPSSGTEELYDTSNTKLRPAMKRGRSRANSDSSTPSIPGSGKSTRFEEDADLAQTRSDGMMDGDRSSSTYWTLKRAAQKWEGASRVLRANVTENTAKVLLNDRGLRKDMELRLIHIESVAKVDRRKGPLNRVKWLREGKPSWDDPNLEHWDEGWGSLPTLGVEAALLIASIFSPEKVSTVGKLMIERTNKSPSEKEGVDRTRYWKDFVKRAAIGEELSPERLCIGWFADSYRCVGSSSRMIVTNEPVDMTQQLGNEAYYLQYLETIGWWFWLQKVFGGIGIDLFGNCLRLNVPTSRFQKGPQGPYEYKYECELTMFMFEGPEADGKALTDWFRRLLDASRSLRSAVTDLNDYLHRKKTDTWGFESLCTRRRVIFRPGFTTLGVSQSLQSSPSGVNRKLARVEKAERKGEVVIFPADHWKLCGSTSTIDRIFQQIITIIFPSEASFFNIRQHLWVTKSLTPDNSTMSNQQIIFALRAISNCLEIEDKSDIPGLNTITRLDFASFVPLVKLPSGHIFFPLTCFPALKEIIIPFRPIDSSPGASAHIVLMRSYGIRDPLSRVNGDAAGPKLRLTVVAPNAESIKTFVKDILKVTHDRAAADVKEKLQPGQASTNRINEVRRNARLTGEAVLKFTLPSVFVVDGSQTPQASIYDAESVSLEELIPHPLKWPEELLDMTGGGGV